MQTLRIEEFQVRLLDVASSTQFRYTDCAEPGNGVQGTTEDLCGCQWDEAEDVSDSVCGLEGGVGDEGFV